MLLTCPIGFSHTTHKLLYNCIDRCHKPQVHQALFRFQLHLKHLIHWWPVFTNSNFKVLRSYKNLSTSLKLLTTNHNNSRLKSMKNAELGSYWSCTASCQMFPLVSLQGFLPYRTPVWTVYLQTVVWDLCSAGSHLTRRYVWLSLLHRVWSPWYQLSALPRRGMRQSLAHRPSVVTLCIPMTVSGKSHNKIDW